MGDISEHFDRSEFACQCGCGLDTVDYELLTILEEVRTLANAPMTINSGIRCPTHNQNEGGGSTSQHLYGKAADFWLEGIHEDLVASYLEAKYEGKYGIGRYNGRTHFDVRSNGPARWDERE